MVETFNKFKDEFLQFELKDGVARFGSQIQEIISQLKLIGQQLQEVGGDLAKLTIEFQQSWAKQEAELATLDYRFAKLALDENELNVVYIDSLTLLKRKTFYGKLLDMVSRKALSFTLVSSDLDNFELVNDHWSHAHGDSAIMQAATCISECVKTWNDGAEDLMCIPFRFGGDEFVFAFISPENAQPQISKLLEELGEKIAHKLREDFSFVGKNFRDRDGEPIHAQGPEVTFGCSESSGCSDKDVWQLHQLYGLAKRRLTEKKRIKKTGAVETDVEKVVDSLKGGTPVAKEQAAGALRNLALNDDNQISIVQMGAIEPLVELLKSGTPVAKENAAVGLQNLAMNGDNQISIVQMGAIEPLVELLKNGTPVAKENAAGALRNLANVSEGLALMKLGRVGLYLEVLANSGSKAAQKLIEKLSDNAA